MELHGFPRVGLLVQLPPSLTAVQGLLSTLVIAKRNVDVSLYIVGAVFVGTKVQCAEHFLAGIERQRFGEEKADLGPMRGRRKGTRRHIVLLSVVDARMIIRLQKREVEPCA